jgi:excisionase family DNA binding protein
MVRSRDGDEPIGLDCIGIERSHAGGGVDESWHLLSVTEIATACRLSEKAVRRAIDDGELLAVKLRSRLRVTPQDFEKWISASRRPGSGPMTPQRQRAPRRAPVGTFRSLVGSEAER